MNHRVLQLDAIWRPATQQRVYRAVLRAFSYPGTVQDLAGVVAPGSAARSVLATLLDGTTSFCDCSAALAPQDAALLACPPAPVTAARFVLADGRRGPAADFEPQRGTLSRPDLGATVVLTVEELRSGPLALVIRGPGVPERRTCELAGVAPEWFAARSRWVAEFPMGVDLLLCDPQRLLGIPRTAELAWKLGTGGGSWDT